MRFLLLTVAIVSLLACSDRTETDRSAATLPPPMSVEALRAADFAVDLTYERALEDGASFTAYLVSYLHAGLKLHAMVAVPRSAMPDTGFPVVVANHGYVPDPRKYGITADGIDSRPGDYYRSVPELYASRGFMVVIPDYRGHNSSEGFEYVNDAESIPYYAEDVVALLSGLADLDNADLDNVVLWSHSMGGPVSMRALLATDVIRAASFWSTMPMDGLFEDLGRVRIPVLLQHSEDDQSTPISNSERFMAALSSSGTAPVLHRYSGAAHYFEEAEREQAADRDAAFFRAASR